MIQKLYGESAVHSATVFHWYNMFSEVRESIRDEHRSGRPMTTRSCENIARVTDILKEDCWSLCILITEWMENQKLLCNKFCVKKLCAWFVLHALTANEKNSSLITLTT